MTIPESLQIAIESCEDAQAKYNALEATATEIGAILPTLRAAVAKAVDDVNTLRDEYNQGSGVPEALNVAEGSIELAHTAQAYNGPLIATLAVKSAELTAATTKSVNDIQTFRDEYEH